MNPVVWFLFIYWSDSPLKLELCDGRLAPSIGPDIWLVGIQYILPESFS